MKINNINSTNFNGIYKIPNTPANIKELEKQVFPVYKEIRHEKICAFVGSNPFKANLTALIKYIAQSNDISIEELKTLAKEDGLDINDLGDDTIHIITGNKDNERFNDFITKRLSKQSEEVQKIECFFAFFKDKLNLPEYLNDILYNIILDEQENMAFNRFAEKVIDVKTPYQFIKKAFEEK